MRINKYIALHSRLSRRSADLQISLGNVTVNGNSASTGMDVTESDEIKVSGRLLSSSQPKLLILLNKPAGFVVSRNGQGAPTVYDLLPEKYKGLKAIGRLDKDSTGLLLLTNDGELAQELTHPSKNKTKVYKVNLNRGLDSNAKNAIEHGIKLDDGISSLKLTGSGISWTVSMHEGRNRQIRRTFEAAGYKVTKLHRIKFGIYELSNNLRPGKLTEIK